LPIYTCAHERAERALYNNVDGWFVVRALTLHDRSRFAPRHVSQSDVNR
jgi:hypothetical protein